MASFDMTFDAREWIREHGVAARGREVMLHLSSRYLGSTVHIPSCASWEFQELGVGQAAWDQHQGFRGTIGDLLEKARSDVERNRNMYGAEAAAKFDAVLERIGRIFDGALDDDDTNVSLTIRDASGLCGISADLSCCTTKDVQFERSEQEHLMLIPLGAPASEEVMSTVDQIAELIRKASRIVALTGAGISVESGITPFRSPSDNDSGSIWGTFNAAQMTVQNFNRDADVTESWWKMKRSLIHEMRTATPNPAHTFFALLEQQGKLGAVVTQNIDSLHQKAGVSFEKVIELHGHMRGLICSDYKTILNPQPYMSGECTFSIPEKDVDSIAAVYADVGVPLCPDCGCPLRTETVMFGQAMPQSAVDRACSAIRDADLLIIIGSTLIVQPANELPCIALRNGAPVVIINFDPTQYDAYAKGLVRQKAGEFLGAVAEKLKQLPGSHTPALPLRVIPECANEFQSPEHVRDMRVKNEGTRCGKEIHSNAKACGMTFFCTAVAEPQGDFRLLELALEAVNAECPDIGKMLFSDGPEKLAVVVSIPEEMSTVLSCGEWLRTVSHVIGGTILHASDTYAKMVVEASSEACPIKLKEPGIMAAIKTLKDKGLFPVVDEDDELIFGDDDFPLS
eukprot:TRINITY_DN17625_c0_g2_i1.p1 TRINITY_DN17625_c0_g2~~TRINITY_DN17625_c0_g2_i1.p1  ORF type:complete len:625 (+),score=62.31 TRINITY_DN17625_c0_g2_i1:63-1937(+)